MNRLDAQKIWFDGGCVRDKQWNEHEYVFRCLFTGTCLLGKKAEVIGPDTCMTLFDAEDAWTQWEEYNFEEK